MGEAYLQRARKSNYVIPHPPSRRFPPLPKAHSELCWGLAVGVVSSDGVGWVFLFMGKVCWRGPPAGLKVGLVVFVTVVSLFLGWPI